MLEVHVTTASNDSNNRQRPGTTGFWGKPLVSAEPEPDTTEDESIASARGAARRSVPRVGPSPKMEQLPVIESQDEADALADAPAETEFVPVPEVLNEYDRIVSSERSVPEWLQSAQEDMGYERPGEELEVDGVQDDYNPYDEYGDVDDVDDLDEYEDEEPYEAYVDEDEFEGAEVEYDAEDAYEEEGAYDAEGEYEEEGVYDEGAIEYGEGDEFVEDYSLPDIDEGLEGDYEFEYEEGANYGLDSTMSLQPLEVAGDSHTGVTAVHEALSWDDDAVVGGRRVAGLHLFGSTGSAASYESGPSVYDEGEEPGEDAQGMRVRAIAVGVSVAAALILVYILGVQRFSTRTLPRTYVGDVDVSGLTVDQVQKTLEEDTAAFACEVKAGDFSGTVRGMDIGLDRDEGQLAQLAIKNQSAFTWPISLIFSSTVNGGQGVTFDEGALTNVVNAMADEYNRSAVTAENLEIVFNEEQNLYQVVGSASGRAVAPQEVDAALKQELRTYKRSCELDANQIMHDATVDDVPDYARVVECANRSRTSDIPILVNGEPVITATADQNSYWVTIGEGPSVVVNEEAIRWWTQESVVWAAYHEDEFNYYYLDQDAFVSEMVNRLTNGIVDGFEAPVIEERTMEGQSRDYAYERGGWNPDLGRYIDVDLEAQFARLFSETGEVLWETAVVTGDLYEGRSTATGVFNIYSMETGVTLVGLDENGDGQPDYESYVSYWMPFYGGLGLHDATWRYDFGGSLYAYDGSHGCVNLPFEKAEQLFNMTFVGEAVYVHW